MSHLLARDGKIIVRNRKPMPADEGVDCCCGACWYNLTPCDCTYNGETNLYVPCALVAATIYVKIDGKCYTVATSDPNVSSLPAGAVEITELTDTYESCDDCCDPVPDCNDARCAADCPSSIVVTVAGVIVSWPGLANVVDCDPESDCCSPINGCVAEIDGSSTATQDVGNECAWDGSTGILRDYVGPAFCDEVDLPVTYGIECQLNYLGSGVDVWLFVMNVGSTRDINYIKAGGECPLGTYTFDSVEGDLVMCAEGTVVLS